MSQVRRGRTLAERFKQKVRLFGKHMPGMRTRCEEWKGATVTGGYGHISVNGKNQLAHRTAWFLKHGKWPERDLLHRCDNTACVRVSHLREGTDLDNARDRTRKGRGGSHKGELNGRAKLVAADVTEMRRLHAEEGATQEELAVRFKSKQQRVSDILLRKRWDSVP